jgi:hypothetical protein
MGVLGVLRILGRMGKRHIIENSPAQQDSKNSNSSPLYSLHELHGEKMFSAQPHSKMYNFKAELGKYEIHGKKTYNRKQSCSTILQNVQGGVCPTADISILLPVRMMCCLKY